MDMLANLDAEKIALIQQTLEVRRLCDNRKGAVDTLRKRLIRMYTCARGFPDFVYARNAIDPMPDDWLGSG
jgi:hypothetical protein